MTPRGLSNPDGWELARRLLRPRLPHDTHDYILEGLCKAIDGINVISILQTGGGKSSLFYGYILLIQALNALSPPCEELLRAFPKNPAMVVVFPTKGLEEDMEARFKGLGINAVAINEDTLASARRSDRNLWAEAIASSMVLLSPEQLVSPSFNTLLAKREFTSRLCALGVDEIHLVNDWGDPDFREAFRRIGHVLVRLPPKTTFIGVTATLLAGIDTSQLLATLGLPQGSCFFQRRSNIRHDIRTIFRTLRHGLGGWEFPDLHWVARSRRKTIIYCETISLGFRLRIYLLGIAPQKRIRIYNSMSFPTYNQSTRGLFEVDPDIDTVIATDSLVVGFNFSNVADVIILGCAHPNRDVQCKGRTGRPGGHIKDPRGITYITKATLTNAQKLLDSGSSSKHSSLHPGMASLILAPTGCHNKELDILYGNPESDPQCRCETCLANPPMPRYPCKCSQCCVDIPPFLPPLSRAPAKPAIRMNERLTEAMRRQVTARLIDFRDTVWRSERIQSSYQFIPPQAILPDGHIKLILDRFAHITSISHVNDLTSTLDLLHSHEASLYIIIMEFRATFANSGLNLPIIAPPLPEGSSADIVPPRTSEVTLDDGAGYTVTIQQQPTIRSPLALTSSANSAPRTVIVLRPHKRKLQDVDRPSERRRKHDKENIGQLFTC